MKQLNTIAEQLFNEIRGRFPSVELGDAEGNVTNEPTLARFYDFEFESNGNKLGKVSVSLDEDNGVVIMFNKNFIENQYGSTKTDWYGFLKNMRTFTKKRLLNFEVRDINRTNLTKRDYKFLATNRRGEQTMAESRMYGNAKTSYQKIGNAKLSIKHSGAIEEGTSRTQKIGAIYIENTDGEKFKYPFKHLSGARALAIHVSEGGNPYDDFGKYITGLSEELSNLRKFKTYMGRSSVMAESLSEHMDVVNERIVTVKKQIQNLQKPSFYTQAFEEFVPIEETQVPEDVAANWVDQLTIKQFNEELQDVFPYIYNLVSEATKSKEITFEDIVSENVTDSITYEVQPGDTVTKIVQNMNDEGIETTVDQVMMDNKRFIDSKGNVKAGTILQIREPSAAPTTSLRPQARPTNIGAGGTREIAPNGQVTGSTRGIDPALNYGESIDLAIETLMGQFGSLLKEKAVSTAQQQAAGIALKHKREGTQPKAGSASASMMNMSTAELEKIAGTEHKGLPSHVEGDKGKIDRNGDGKNDWDDVKLARMAAASAAQGDDEDETNESKIPLGEFILSYFDRESGQFPKGPTAVLTMVEKEYGDQYVRPASKFIERINQRVAEIMGYRENDFEVQENPELDRISSLAGLR